MVPILELNLISVSWDEVEQLALELSSMIRRSYWADLIIGIARGGWVVARLLSDYLEVPNIASVRVEFYKDVGMRQAEPKITQPLTVPVRGLNVLIADDVADSGSSILKVRKHAEERGAKSIKTATLHLKPWSKVKPDYYAKVVSGWVIYPWEVREVTKSLVKGWKREGLDPHAILQKLLSVGLKKELIVKILEDVLLDQG